VVALPEGEEAAPAVDEEEEEAAEEADDGDDDGPRAPRSGRSGRVVIGDDEEEEEEEEEATLEEINKPALKSEAGAFKTFLSRKYPTTQPGRSLVDLANAQATGKTDKKKKCRVCKQPEKKCLGSVFTNYFGICDGCKQTVLDEFVDERQGDDDSYAFKQDADEICQFADRAEIGLETIEKSDEEVRLSRPKPAEPAR
jgi:hypothetical protein